MYTQIAKKVALATLTVVLTGCSMFMDKDNTPTPTPLTSFKPEMTPQRVFTIQAGGGGANEFLKMNLASDNNTLFAVSTSGVVSSINKTNGHINWRANTKLSVSAGPGAGSGIVVIGSRKGEVVALRQADGAQIWKTSVPDEILAQPTVGRYVVIKAIDGHVRAFSPENGSLIWSFQQIEPNLVLHAASTPLISDNSVFVGYANGNLVRLNANNGDLLWQQPIAIAEGAFAIQRMIDIDANPVIYNHHVYAATYQGKIASLDWRSGEPIWSRDISSYTGMSADNNTIYISDAQSNLWAFNASTGNTAWQQTKLAARVISAPASIGNYIVVGDAEGYVHWLNKTDGHFAARDYVGNKIFATPLVENGIVYILTSSGSLTAYKLG